MADVYTVTGSVKAVIDLTLKVVSTSLAQASYKTDKAALKHVVAIANGEGDNKAGDLYDEIVALGNGATGTIDFVSATANRFGRALAWDLLKGLFLFAPATNTDTVTIGGAANAVIPALPPLPPGASYLFQWPLIATAPVIADGASDILTMVNDDAGGPAVLHVLAWGEVA